MLLIIENSKEARLEIRSKFFRKLAFNTCGASYRYVDAAFQKHRIHAAYIPNTETIPNPIGFCRRFKAAHPRIPLIASVPREGCRLDLDALYTVTDNIPLSPLPLIRLAEIVCELERLYTGRDTLEQSVGSLKLNTYSSTIFFCGRPISMSVSALSILRYLCHEAPRPVPAQELLISVGAPDRRRSVSCIHSHISDLNHRAIAAVGRPIVRHLPKKGYIIDVFGAKRG